MASLEGNNTVIFYYLLHLKSDLITVVAFGGSGLIRTGKYTMPWAGFELTTLMMIGTDWIGSCKSNYHMITTMMHILLSVASEVWSYYSGCLWWEWPYKNRTSVLIFQYHFLLLLILPMHSGLITIRPCIMVVIIW
jgi:hypothetical protein